MMSSLAIVKLILKVSLLYYFFFKKIFGAGPRIRGARVSARILQQSRRVLAFQHAHGNIAAACVGRRRKPTLESVFVAGLLKLEVDSPRGEKKENNGGKVNKIVDFSFCFAHY